MYVILYIVDFVHVVVITKTDIIDSSISSRLDSTEFWEIKRRTLIMVSLVSASFSLDLRSLWEIVSFIEIIYIFTLLIITTLP